MAPKKMMPRKTLMPWRQLRMIHPLPTANANRRQAHAQREEEINRFLPADDAHRRIVSGGRTGVRWQMQRGRMGILRGY